MALSKAVQDLVDRVAASTSLETSSAAALAELVNQSAQLHKQIDDLTAASGTLGVDDTAAITKAAADLAASAAALQTATPANTPPPAAPPVVITPVTPPV